MCVFVCLAVERDEGSAAMGKIICSLLNLAGFRNMLMSLLGEGLFVVCLRGWGGYL